MTGLVHWRRGESESRAQRFNVVHLSFAKKEAALQQRAEEAELTVEHLRQVRLSCLGSIRCIASCVCLRALLW